MIQYRDAFVQDLLEKNEFIVADAGIHTYTHTEYITYIYTHNVSLSFKL